MPKDVYGLIAGKGQITDQLLREGYAGNPEVWVMEYGGVDQWVFDSFVQVIETERAIR